MVTNRMNLDQQYLTKTGSIEDQWLGLKIQKGDL